MSKEESIRKLAEAKAYLEKRMADIQEEASKIKSILEVVDTSLAEKSFKKVELPPSKPQEPRSAPIGPSQEDILRQAVPLKTPEGMHLADMSQTDDELIITPAPGMKFDVASPPFRAFLIGRVLEPMRSRDNASVKVGELSPEKVLSYTVEQDENLVRALAVKNYGDERRLQELKNAIRWTLRRMYERTLAHTNE
ncbi:hypothetical protein MUP05_09930 [Candidatus Bathyarchaeota archaeon]|jgi:hypothetical protein|nr:hypothetical protein [Candidatus Bathyarchaeota archaeon]